MKVVHVSTYDISGGAARAAYRLHRGLLQLGHESVMFVLRRRSHDPNIVEFRPPRDLRHRLVQRLRYELITRSFKRYKNTRPEGYERFSDDRSKYGVDLVKQLPQADVINLHWVADFVDYRSFFDSILKEQPVVWTLHDMNPFTGGCHYDQGCGKYTERCGACPQLGAGAQNDLSREVWLRKREAILNGSKKRLQVVGDSFWLADRARQSTLLGDFPNRTIHYGLDTEVFAPRDKLFSRSVLGVHSDASVVLFSADSLTNQRKGFDLLLNALQDLKDVKDVFLLSFGRESAEINNPIPYLNLGYINNDRLMSLIYSAADIFVIPSIQEAFGQTALEAISCGLPVVGFDVGGIPDMVRPGVTGQLAPVSDVEALRETIARLLQDQAMREEMSENCRRIATEEFALEIQAQNYLELYESLF